MEPNINFSHVSKKFSQRYLSDSLRDILAKPFKTFLKKKSFDNKEFWALKDISFKVNPGEALGIIGSNGSGKTTTLKILSRILRPDGGKIVVKGRIGALIELGAGFNPDLNGRENIFLNATILGMTRDEIENKYNDIVNFAELHDFMETPVKWYSTGMFARLGFSVAVHTDPDVLLVDEILSVGDIGFQKKCFDRMKLFKNNGTTIVFVSHNLQAVASLCDRVVMLDKGNKVCEGEPDKVINHYFDSMTTKESNSDKTEFIELKKGIIFDDQNEPKNVFQSADNCRIDMEILFKKTYPNIYISTYIRSKSDTKIFSTNSMRLSGKPFSVSEGESTLFSLGLTINLAPGVYDVGMTVFDRTVNKWLINKRVSTFVVAEDPHFQGIVFMNPQLLDLKVLT